MKKGPPQKAVTIPTGIWPTIIQRSTLRQSVSAIIRNIAPANPLDRANLR